MDATAAHDVELTHWGRLAMRRKWVVLGVVALSLTLAAWVLEREHPQYRSTATVAVERAVGPAAEASREGRSIDDDLALANGDLLKEQAEAAVAGDLDLEATATAGSRLLQLTGTASTAPDALAGTKAYLTAYLTLRQRTLDGQLDSALASLENALASVDDQLGRAPSATERQALVTQRSAYAASLEDLRVRKALAVSGRPQVVAAPRESVDPVPPPHLAFGAVGLLVGLVLGLVAAAIVDHRDDSIRDVDGLREAAAAHLPTQPVATGVSRLLPEELGVRRRGRMRWKHVRTSAVPLVAPAGTVAADSWTRARVAIDHGLALGRAGVVLQVTSPRDDNAAAEAALNLAASYGRSGLDVILVDLDTRTPHRILKAATSPGTATLSNGAARSGAFGAILGRVDLRDVLLPVLDMPNVLVSMPGPHPSPVDVLALASATDFFLELRSAADVVLVLAPPSVPFPEASLVATHTDGAVLVARAGTTRARDVRAASRLLAQAEERLVAVLLVAPPVRRVSRVAPSALPVDHQDLRLVPPRVVTAARGG